MRNSDMNCREPFQPTLMETPLTPLEFGRRARKLYPERVAVIDGDSRWTYAQLLDRCDRWSAALQKLGIKPGDRVAYLSPNTHAQLESFHELAKAEADILQKCFHKPREVLHCEMQRGHDLDSENSQRANSKRV